MAVVLCLGVVALLGVVASPAAAATCVDCHAEPPDGPPAPHGVLVAAVTDCVTCHRGMSPHPASLRIPGLSLRGNSSASGLVLTGKLWQPGVVSFIDGPSGSYMLKVGLPDVTVYLQQRLWADTEFTDVTQVTTAAGMFSEGAYSYTVPFPVPFAAYRALSQGTVLTPDLGSSSFWRPAASVLLPKPQAHAQAGRPHRRVHPSRTEAQGERHGGAHQSCRPGRLREVARKVGRRWADVRTASNDRRHRHLSWTFTVRKRGLFRIRAMIEATPDTADVVTTWRRFAVK